MSHNNPILEKRSVLVLNRNWQAIHVKTPLESFSMMFDGSAIGLDVTKEDEMNPLKWKDWVQLPYDKDAEYIKTVRGEIKVPKIIILCHFNQIPKRRPKFTAKNLWERDKGICQYTGKKLTPNEGNIDHVIPKSRGGKTSWTNCVLSHKDVNAQKGDKTPSEAGLSLIKPPKEPTSLPTTFFIQNVYNIREWKAFLVN
jgi:5-methylcytosine-specific restriction endonuclease McrA